MESPLRHVARWPTVSSTVSPRPSAIMSALHLPLAGLLTLVCSQTPSPWPTTAPVDVRFGCPCSARASPGTQTKTSSSATQARKTRRLLRRLKVTVIKTPESVSLLCSCCRTPEIHHLWCNSSTGTVQPLYWQKPVYDLDPSDPTNNGFINDDLIVWMREAAFPNFKKLYGVLNRADKPFTRGLPSGNYSIDISYSILSPLRLVSRLRPIVWIKVPLFYLS